MRIRWLPLSALAIVGIGSLCIIQFARLATERAIIQSYKELDVRFGRKDLIGYMALLTPDYSEVRLTERPRDRAQAQDNYNQIMKDWSAFSSSPAEVDAFKEDADYARVTVKRRVSGEMLDRNGAFGAKGRSHKMVTVTVSLDVWQRINSSWLLKHHNIALAQVYVDNKLLPGGNVHDDD